MAGAERQRGSRPVAMDSARLPRSLSVQLEPAQLTLDSARQEKNLENLGRMLKTKREINGLTRRDVALKIKIPMDQLEAIEDGRLSALPQVFAKGFLRAYANELGLDAEAILDDYRKMSGGLKNDLAGREPLTSRYEETRLGAPLWTPGRLGLIAIIIILAVAGGLLGVWPGFRQFFLSFWPAAERGETGAVSASAGRSALESPALPLDQPPSGPEPVPPSGQDGDVAVASGRLAAPPAISAVQPARPTASGQDSAANNTGGELTLVSQKDGVWVQILADGRPIEHFWLKRGQKLVRRVDSAIMVRTGQAAALDAFWNGSALGPLSDEPVVEVGFPPG